MTNNEKQRRVPQLRFRGFTDDWEQRKLGELGSFYYGKSAPKWSVSEEAKTPCVRYGELYTKFGAKISRTYSKTNIDPETLKYSTGHEVLIPRVGEEPLDFSNASWLPISGVAIGEMISVFNSKQNPLFLAYYIRGKLKIPFAKLVEGGNVSNLYYVYLKNVNINIPSLKEQKLIAAQLEKIDNTITLHQRKHELLLKLKKAYLQKLFPKNGEKIPELRFEGFTDDWEQRKLGEISLKIGSGKTPKGGKEVYSNNGVPFLRSQNIHDDRVDLSGVAFITNETDEQMSNSRVMKNDVLLNITGASIGRSAVYTESSPANVNQHVCIIRLNDIELSSIIQTKLASNDGQNQININQAGGGREGLNFRQISNFSFVIPNKIDEIKLINKFVQVMNTVIALHQRKLDALRKLKQAYLQKLFV